MKAKPQAARKQPPPRAAGPSKPYSLRIDPDHFARAQALAKRKGVTVAAVIQMALAEKLEREERGRAAEIAAP